MKKEKYYALPIAQYYKTEKIEFPNQPALVIN